MEVQGLKCNVVRMEMKNKKIMKCNYFFKLGTQYKMVFMTGFVASVGSDQVTVLK